MFPKCKLTGFEHAEQVKVNKSHLLVVVSKRHFSSHHRVSVTSVFAQLKVKFFTKRISLLL